MLVFGDKERSISVHETLGELSQSLSSIPHQLSLIAHAARADIFIEAAELAQGIADAHFNARGVDNICGDITEVTDILMLLAALLQGSWENSFRPDAAISAKVDQAIKSLMLSQSLPEAVSCRRSEGYAFYALYPELYLQAAKSLMGRSPRVIGLRSIGFSLAALVAQGAGASRPLSLRPIGHPFRRELRIHPDILTDLPSTSDYAVVDEGPGLSGSSFGAVIDKLEGQGIPLSRLHIFPSHAGTLGPEADPRHRERWHKIAKHCVSFDDFFLNESCPHPVSDWARDLLGPSVRPLEDLSGGAWRYLHYADQNAWPPSYSFQERRKFRLHTQSGTWLLKFSGLGRYGEEKLRRARALHYAGFIPEVRDLRHGFLVERWAEARPFDPNTISRGALIDRLSRYLGFRAKTFTIHEAGAGASLDELSVMLKRNASEACGVAACDLDLYGHAATKLERQIRRIVTDNRLHRWEWLMSADGTLMKTDSLDHAQTHDLVGCQDVAWDIAGAIVEFALDEIEADELRERVGRERGEAISRDLLSFLLPCYSAFQLGLADMARRYLASKDADAVRLATTVERYRKGLDQQLSFRL